MINVSAPYMIDAYKIGHIEQYPDNVSLIMSNLTPRKSRVPDVDRVLWFGLHYFIQEYLVNHWDYRFFRNTVGKAEASFYKDNVNKIIGPNRISSKHIFELHKLKHLPIRIMALPEGSLVPFGVPPLVIHSTRPEFAWLVNYLETILSCIIWQPATSATTCFYFRAEMERHAIKVGGSRAFVKWQLHDFSMRGMPGFEAACMSGCAHLMVAKGSDTVPALFFMQQYYSGENEISIDEIGGSVNATEHSVMCISAEYIQVETTHKDGTVTITTETNELKSFKRLIRKFGYGILSIVSDSFNFWRVLDEYLPAIKEEIMNRHHYVANTDFDNAKVGAWFLPNNNMETGELESYWCSENEQNYSIDYVLSQGENVSRVEGKVVIRGDSGDPVNILTGYFGEELEEFKNGDIFVISDKRRKISLTEKKGLIERLWDIFGGTHTDKGYKSLDQHVNVIYGDGITYEREKEILYRCEEKGFYFSGVLGMGSFTYQYVTRDTYGWAMKATYGEIITGEEVVNGNIQSIIKEIEIFKDPITDDGTKRSARGITAVFKNEEGDYYLKDRATMEEFNNCELKCAFHNGEVPIYPTMYEVRDRIDENIEIHLNRKKAA